MTERTLTQPPSRPVKPSGRPLRLWQELSSNPEVHIEIVPLIDVIFCILIFFILGAIGLSRQQAISLNLPKASTGTAQMREMLVVSLDEFGQTYVEKQPVTVNQLSEALRNYHQFNPNGLMVLHASRNASYNEVIQVLDLLRQVGGDRVALATLPGEPTASSPSGSYSNFNSLPGQANPFPQDLPGLGNLQPDSSLPQVPSPPLPGNEASSTEGSSVNPAGQ